MKPIGPFWRYYGGKWRAAPRYPEPRHKTIIEPFAGAAGYACRYWWLDVVLIDIDPTIAGIWRWLIDARPDDVLAVPDVPDGGTVDDIQAPKAARDLVGFWCNTGTSSPRKTKSKWTRHGNGRDWSWARARVASWVAHIKHWTIIEGSYHDAPDDVATWFVDPPYQTTAGRRYRHSEIDYKQLGQWCKTRQGQVITCDQEGATWIDNPASITIKSARGRSHEIVGGADDPQIKLWSL